VAEANGTVLGLVYVAGATILFFTIVLRFGFLAGVTLLIVHRLLTRIPLTLDRGAWYADASLMPVLMVLGLALWACRTAVDRHDTRPRPQAPIMT
jgi:hypothetical protein